MMHCACQKQEQHRVENTDSEMAARSSRGSILFFFFCFPGTSLSKGKTVTDLTFYFSLCSFFPSTSLVLKLLENRGTNRPIVETMNNK